MVYKLTKNLYKNPLIFSAISTTISEFDIKAAFPHALYDITRDFNEYTHLMNMDKFARNSTIGKMQKKDKSLFKKIENCMIKYLNNFMDANNITINNFVESTRDSILVVNCVALKTKFAIDDKVSIEFVKKGVDYTSLFRIKNYLVLYDSFTNSIKIKGISDKVIKESSFINNYYKSFINGIEKRNQIKHISKSSLLEVLKMYRLKYIKAKDKSIYKSVLHNNEYVYYKYNSETTLESDILIDDPHFSLCHGINYVELVLPLYSSIIF